MPLASLMLGVCEEVGCGACDETVMIDGRFMRLVCQLLLSRYALATVVAHIDCSRCAHVVERSRSRRFARAFTAAGPARDSISVGRGRRSISSLNAQ
jgi:hypothetical protein